GRVASSSWQNIAGAGGIMVGDDIAYNKGTYASPRDLRELLFPLLASQAEAIKRAGALPMFHSDGDLRAVFPDIIQAGKDEPLYTNSSQLPVEYTDDIFECMDLQDELQSLYTGGTVQHLYLGEKIDDINVIKELIRTVFEKYKMPYISITPTFSICNTHGYISGEQFTCPECGAETEVWSRVVGYLRPVQNYNPGKKEEYMLRTKFVV
ncbi:MAG TPA: anaerobic ribonucleoside-triphosphate reductase, partial [Oscillospiraceae bacterium]|nr:anaerobic ribonucleoside-triphosphate reductase [Oscillospiraceae bacterium]